MQFLIGLWKEQDEFIFEYKLQHKKQFKILKKYLEIDINTFNLCANVNRKCSSCLIV